MHKEQPFRVVGILARTGTPVDRAIHVPLEGLDAIHARENALKHGHDAEHAISAFLVGLESRGSAMSVQRQVNEFAEEPLTAILPGVTLLEVWEIAGAVERTLLAVSVLVVAVGLAGMLVALLTSLNERRREMAVLRSVGARPLHIFALVLGEAAFLTLVGIALGVAALYAGLAAGQPWLESRLGLFIALGWPSAYEFDVMILVAVAGGLIGLIPAWRIYRYSLADGMTIRI
jgi:putative ABC transport system permease protein